MNTLAEYRAEVERTINGSDRWAARESLRHLSAEIRRKLWNDRAAAQALARKADDAAREIEIATPGMMPTAREPRFPAVYQGGILSPAVD